ncbi:hypothetical protein A2U01_0037851 [Trifolium medium]|uniref:Uncharacterized protein n=1 Tax=Trifolium medium TaxID=97028 RepID=A0A392PYC2_9FABA|nr:hypothetical protein [Trifolium medium]
MFNYCCHPSVYNIVATPVDEFNLSEVIESDNERTNYDDDDEVYDDDEDEDDDDDDDEDDDDDDDDDD